jgi:hypothetical protein
VGTLIWLLSAAFAAPDDTPATAADSPVVRHAREKRWRKRRAEPVVPEAAEAEPAAPTVEVVEAPLPEKERPRVDLVVALDVSGSMERLLDSARMKLWGVVEQVSRAEPQPAVRVGLYTYGNSDPASESYIRRELPLTEDLDRVWERIVQLTTSGSEEYVGWVISEATRDAGWSELDNIGLLFVCGNETADQMRSRFDFRHTAEVARAAGVTVNAIYGGTDVEGQRDLWPDVARAGGGIYAPIDMAAGTVRLPPAPQDGLLEELNAQLNETYVTIRGGEDGKARQLASDLSSAALGTSGTRISTKGSGVYRAPSWDLVDGWEAGRVDLSRTELLPSHLHPKSVAEREAYVRQLRDFRHQVQARIRAVSAERTAWLEAERAKVAAAQPTDLGEAINAAVREQLIARGLSFPAQ